MKPQKHKSHVFTFVRFVRMKEEDDQEPEYAHTHTSVCSLGEWCEMAKVTGEPWTFWTTAAVAMFSVLQVKGVTSAQTEAVTGSEGLSFDLSCEYPPRWRNMDKYFCPANVSYSHCIHTDRRDEWVREGRFSVLDNTTGAVLIGRLDKLVPEDGGTYWCWANVNSHPHRISIIQLTVSRVTETSALQDNVVIDKHNLPLFLTAVSCVTAMLFVSVFTLGLLLACRRPRPQPNAEVSTDYESMAPGEAPEQVVESVARRRPPPPAEPRPPPDLCSHVTAKSRESDVSLHGYANADACSYQYQQLDLSGVQEPVYHSLHANSSSKDSPGPRVTFESHV